MPRAPDPQRQLASFLAKYTSEIEAVAREVLERLEERIPGAVRLVYDNYNALAIGFSPTERASDVIISIALYPRWVSLFFLQAAGLPDPAGILKGNGKVARHVVLRAPSDLDDPAVSALVSSALERAKKRIDPAATSRLIIKSVSAKQRPRRPRT